MFTPTSEAAVQTVEPDTKCSIKRRGTAQDKRLVRIVKLSYLYSTEKKVVS
jgi:hypothetical protein